jgi:hypothetical protein
MPRTTLIGGTCDGHRVELGPETIRLGRLLIADTCYLAHRFATSETEETLLWIAQGTDPTTALQKLLDSYTPYAHDHPATIPRPHPMAAR